MQEECTEVQLHIKAYLDARLLGTLAYGVSNRLLEAPGLEFGKISQQ